MQPAHIIHYFYKFNEYLTDFYLIKDEQPIISH